MLKFFAIALLLLMTWTSNAQSTETPLVIWKDGDIWTWTEIDGLTQLTEWGYNEMPILSPDGTRIAYHSTAQQVIGSANAEMFAGQQPSNIWIWDLTSGEATRIAEQPDNVTASDLSFGVIRSRPTWSPDGSQIAWTQYNRNGDFFNATFQLVVYDFATETSQVIVENLPLGYQDAGIYLPSVEWGESGLLFAIATVLDEGLPRQVGSEIRVFTAQGDLQLMVEWGYAYPYELFWITSGGQEWIAVGYGTGWDLLDPFTGAIQPMDGLPQLVNRLSPDSVAPLLLDIHYGNGSTTYKWNMISAVGESTISPVTETIQLNLVTVGPDGSSVAYLTDDAINTQFLDDVQMLVTDESLTPDYMSGILWSPTTWQVYRGEGVETLKTQPLISPRCDAPQSTLGTVYRVTPPTFKDESSLPLNFYTAGNPPRRLITRIPAGETVTYLETAPCYSIWSMVGGYIWKVDYNGTEGWIYVTDTTESATLWVELVE
jgi:hypothetical protein